MNESSGSEPRLITIVGPTASGKTTLAIHLARELDGEIVNCDSMQMIRQLNIGTDKPPESVRNEIPHHLFNRIDIDEFYSAGKYMKEARAICTEIAERMKVPIVVGGTGLYYRAFLRGIFEGPGKSLKLRRRLNRIIERRGLEFLYDKLREKDPDTVQRIRPEDRIRIIRALEVQILTGQPISKVQKETEELTGFRTLSFGLNPPREVLYGRINRRVEEMFEQGILEEVSSLLEAGFARNAKGFEALGYRYAIDVWEGSISLEEAIELTKRDTRRYAKRQMTWFRKEKDIRWMEMTGETEECLRTVLSKIGDINGN
jgi:tRNA dimethylallyltransferase